MSRKKITPTAKPFLPEKHTMAAAKEAVQSCKGCGLYKEATQAVFGEGLRKATIVLVGEKPGDREDIEGHPFVGPAGRLLSKALEDAGIDRKKVYITNAVKHFKWAPRGKRRIHQKPNSTEIHACQPWLDLEVDLIKPRVLVCLGATAAYSVFGKAVTIKKMRSKFHETRFCPNTIVTIHPSAILRIREREERAQFFKAFVADLKLAIARTD